jgi:threonine dehydrogenase-like Zn-dependent dehydrogenase
MFPVNHRCSPDQIKKAYELFANRRDGVLKVAITPSLSSQANGLP